MKTQIVACRKCGAVNRVPQDRQGLARCGQCKDELDRSGAPQPVLGAVLAAVVARAPIPVLVDFSAKWCGPCRMVEPVLDQLARSRAGELVVLKLDIDDDPDAARRLGVRGVPTFILFQGGREVGRRSGALPLSELDGWVRRTAPSEAAAQRV